MPTAFQLDHFVLTVRDLDASHAFYERLFDGQRQHFGENRFSVFCRSFRIHFHRTTDEILPRAERPTPGSADLCFLTPSLRDFQRKLEGSDIRPILGPAPRNGAAGALTSLYFRDPDGNLIEVAEVTKPLPCAL